MTICACCGGWGVPMTTADGRHYLCLDVAACLRRMHARGGPTLARLGRHTARRSEGAAS